MPIFEWQCQNCQKEFEVLQGREETKAICPKCKSQNTVRLMSTSSWVLKGEGWTRGVL